MSLKEKLSQKLQEKGAITSSDISDFDSPEPVRASVSGTVTATVPKQAMTDDIMNAANKPEVGQAVSREIVSQASTRLTTDVTALPTIELTEAERKTFLDTVVSGDRFVLPFNLFSGKLNGKFRCRSQQESMAVVQQINREVRAQQLLTPLDYSSRLRSMLLAAQVEELNGEIYTKLRAPLQPTVDGNSTTPAAWLDQVKTWEEKSESITTAIYKALAIFERKYWVLVDNGDNQNFWNPAESTLR